MFCPKCGGQVADTNSFCTHCGASLTSQASQTTLAQPGESALSMGWHKFLIYFALWAGAVLNAINAFQMLSGSQYGTDGEAELVYAMFEDLKTLDMGCGILLLALAIFGIYTRFQLSGFKKKGPTMLTVLYAGVFIFDLIYIIGCSSILPAYVMEYVDFTSVYSAMAGSFAIMCVNIAYFKKRAHLFVNE